MDETYKTAGAQVASELTCPQCGALVHLPADADRVVCRWCGSGLERSRLRSRAVTCQPEPSSILKSLRCPQCAGPLSVRAARRMVVCDSCGTRLLVVGDRGVARWYFEAGVDRSGAEKAGAEWLSTYPGLDRHIHRVPFCTSRLVYIPIWEHRALVAGWEFGARLRTRSRLVEDAEGERLELETQRESVAEGRLQERRYFEAACDLVALGATRPRLSGRELLKPLVAGELGPEAELMEVRGDVAEVTRKGRQVALAATSRASFPDCHNFLLRESVSLLFYPLWVLQYRFRDRTYHVVIDGRWRTVNSAVGPADRLKQRLSSWALAAGAAVAVALLIWLGTTVSRGKTLWFATAVLVSVIAVATMLRAQFRTEVEYHEPFSS